MRITSILLLFLLWGEHTLGQSLDVCPTLPANSGLKWNYTEGPDFDICRAMEGDVQVFGVYLGNAPSFRPDKKQRGESGGIGKYKVTWHSMPSQDTSRPIGKQTLIQLNQKPGMDVAHIWITAKDAKEMSRMLAVFKQVNFK